MWITEWLNGIFRKRIIDSKTEKFMKEAEKIKPEKPLNYENEVADVVIEKKDVDL